jgi:hypothetical protein
MCFSAGIAVADNHTFDISDDACYSEVRRGRFTMFR